MKKLYLISKGLIDPKTGKPKSLSPPAWNGLFKKKGMDIVYEVWDTDPEQLTSRIEEIKNNENIIGGNVGTPHKEPFCELLNEDQSCTLEETAKNIGAVNTYRRESRGVAGTITDNWGIIMAVDRHSIGMKEAVQGNKVLILGAGGASLPAMDAVLRYGPESVSIYNRTVEKAQKVARRMAPLYGYSYGKEIRAGSLYSIPSEELKRAKMVINVTKLGMVGELEYMSPLSQEQVSMLPKECVVFDAVYRSANNSLETPLIRMAAKRGLRTVPGHYMLLYQAVKAYEFIFNQSLTEDDIKTMHESMLKGIRGE